MRWLAHRGGALDYRDHVLAHPREPFPVAVALGADPATMLAAVTPVPDALSRIPVRGPAARGNGQKWRAASPTTCRFRRAPRSCSKGTSIRARPRSKGRSAITPATTTSRSDSRSSRCDRITTRRDPIYHSTYTGKPPDEPAVLGVALNEVFVPLLTRQFPEIVDFYLPPEGCSYRLAVVSMKKQYPGHAKRVMFGVWSFLRQFMYTKFIIVTDDDVNVRDWKEVIWALVDARGSARAIRVITERTPIDYLDFASPVPGLGSKMGIDATSKWPGETDRRWGTPIAMSEEVKRRVDELWRELGL